MNRFHFTFSSTLVVSQYETLFFIIVRHESGFCLSFKYIGIRREKLNALLELRANLFKSSSLHIPSEAI